MLRLAALLLLLANLLLLALHGGWVDGWLGRPPGGGLREPERLARQVNPLAVQVLPAASAPGPGGAAPSSSASAPGSAPASAPGAPLASSPASTPVAAGTAPTAAPSAAPAAASTDASATASATASAKSASASPASGAAGPSPPTAVAQAGGPACLEVGPLDKAGLADTQRALLAAGVAAPSWSVQPLPAPPAFLVYMGRFPDQPGLQRKLDELRLLKVPAVELKDAPPLQPGLVLGRHPSADAAEAAMAALTQRGVRTARVVPAPARPSSAVRLRLPAANAALRARLAGVRLPGGLALRACTSDDTSPAAPAR